MTDPTEISTLTEAQLAKLEEKVRRGSAAFIEVGTALAKIRDEKGYRLRGFDTFERYCADVLGITDRHGRRLIQSAETAVAVRKLTGTAPATESVARELATVVAEPEKFKRVEAQLEKSGYSVVTATAEAVKEAVQKLAPKPAPATRPGTGRAVGVPGNGHKATPAKGIFVTPANVWDVSTQEGACPHCGEMPDRYDRMDEVWQCSDCKGVVMLSVIKWPEEAPQSKVKQCPMCMHDVVAGEPFCDQCGEKL